MFPTIRLFNFAVRWVDAHEAAFKRRRDDHFWFGKVRFTRPRRLDGVVKHSQEFILWTRDDRTSGRFTVVGRVATSAAFRVLSARARLQQKLRIVRLQNSRFAAPYLKSHLQSSK